MMHICKTVGRGLFYIGRGIRECGQELDYVGHRLQGRYPAAEEITLHRKVMPMDGISPKIGKNSFVAPSASVIGNTELGTNCSVWYGTVIRADIGKIRIGDNVSIGDNTVVHLTRQGLSQTGFPTNIGHNVTIGAGSFIHGCTLEDECTIGVGCTILDGAVVGTRSQLGPGSLLLPGTRIPPNQYWAGSPAKYERDITNDDLKEAQKEIEAAVALCEEHNRFHDTKSEL